MIKRRDSIVQQVYEALRELGSGAEVTLRGTLARPGAWSGYDRLEREAVRAALRTLLTEGRIAPTDGDPTLSVGIDRRFRITERIEEPRRSYAGHSSPRSGTGGARRRRRGSIDSGPAQRVSALIDEALDVIARLDHEVRGLVEEVDRLQSEVDLSKVDERRIWEELRRRREREGKSPRRRRSG